MEQHNHIPGFPPQRRVDVIIPVFNVAKYLRRCLDSIRSQTLPLWRAICVDDGSTDGSDIVSWYRDNRYRTQVRLLKALGLDHTVRVYSAASFLKRELWRRNCKWPVIELRIARYLDSVGEDEKGGKIRELLQKLWERKVFDDCASEGERQARRSIGRFLGVEV